MNNLKRQLKRISLFLKNKVDTYPISSHDYKSIQHRGDTVEFISPRAKILSTITYLIRQLATHNKESIKILDVGARDGWTVDLFNQIGYPNVIGVELIDELVTHAKSKGRNVISGDIHKLPFNNNSFDIVFCRHTLEHTIDPYKAMAEIIRVSRTKGGIIFISLPLERKARGKHTTAIPNLRILKRIALSKGNDSISIIQAKRSSKTKTIIPDGDEAFILLSKH